MKITEAQLRHIIREEVKRVVSEVSMAKWEPKSQWARDMKKTDPAGYKALFGGRDGIKHKFPKPFISIAEIPAEYSYDSPDYLEISRRNTKAAGILDRMSTGEVGYSDGVVTDAAAHEKLQGQVEPPKGARAGEMWTSTWKGRPILGMKVKGRMLYWI